MLRVLSATEPVLSKLSAEFKRKKKTLSTENGSQTVLYFTLFLNI